MSIKKNIASKIIITAPPSVEYGPLIPARLKATAIDMDTILQNWALKQSDFFYEEEWEEVQFEKIKKILNHASLHVPYWRNLFERLKFNPQTLATTEELKVLPVTTRENIKKTPLRNWLSENLECTRFVETFTSGSTGEPLRLFQDVRDQFRRNVNMVHEFRYLGRAHTNSIIKFDLSTRKDLDSVGVRINPRDLEYKEKRISSIYSIFGALPGSILMATPSYLERFTYFCKRDKFTPNLDCIIYTAEQLIQKNRKEFEVFFQCPLFSTYATTECSLIGIQCEKKNFHVAPWMSYIEILDDQHRQLPDGRVGNIVVTFFENEAMPFIRYAIGDTGSYKKERCQCGRSSKIIEFTGRSTGNIILPDGTAYPVFHLFYNLTRSCFAKIKKFQIEQKSQNAVILRLVPIEENRILNTKDIEEIVRRELGDKILFRIEILPWIKPNRSGKTPLFVSSLSSIA